MCGPEFSMVQQAVDLKVAEFRRFNLYLMAVERTTQLTLTVAEETKFCLSLFKSLTNKLKH